MAYTAPSITASGTTFAQFRAGGASGHLERLIAAQAATAAPTAAPTLAASGTGNTLPAATYYVVFTETNGIGETTASPVSAAQAVTAGQELTITFPTLQAGNVARRAYAGTAAAGPFTLAATGITASSVNITAPLPANSYAVNPPTVNSTGLTWVDANGVTRNKALQLVRSAKDGNLETLYRFLRTVIADFNQGEPQPFNLLETEFRTAHTAFALLAQLCAEMGTLIDANAGTLGAHATGIGGSAARRTWP